MITQKNRPSVYNRNNRSEGGNGGGINVVRLISGMSECYSAPVVDSNTFTSNRAELRGGAIFVEAMNEILNTWQHPWSGINIPSGNDATNTYSGNTHGFGFEGKCKITPLSQFVAHQGRQIVQKM